MMNEAGDEGGRVVAVGTPEEIAGVPASYTGQYLKQVLDKSGDGASARGKTASAGARQGRSRRVVNRITHKAQR